MSEEGVQLDAYEESDSIGPAILYPIIGSVFLAFCIISVAAFLLSNRRCCKKGKHTDVESMLLKKKLVSEQKRLSNYGFKFPFGGRPLFSSIMQQEDNTIAQEVKESYKTISTDVTKPILCCPENPISYIYNPRPPECIQKSSDDNFLGNDAVKSYLSSKNKEYGVVTNGINPAESENIIDCEEDSLDGEDPSNELQEITIKNSVHEAQQQNCFLDSLEKKPLKEVPSNLYAKKHAKLFTESEIKGSTNVKALFFDKWIQNSEQVDMPEYESSHSDDIVEPDLNFDDVDSILTSISRMDSSRMKKLKDSKFYKSLITQMDTINADNTPMSDEQMLSPEILDDMIASKIGNEKYQNLTHEELMLVVATPVKHSSNKTPKNVKHEKDGGEHEYTRRRHAKEREQPNQETLHYKEEHCKELRHHLTRATAAVSESLFKVVPSDLPIAVNNVVYDNDHSAQELAESEITKLSETKVTSTALKRSTGEVYDDTSYGVETLSCSGVEASPSRPNSLNLKRKNTELKIDSSFSDAKSMSKSFDSSHNTSNASAEETSYTSSDSINESGSSKGTLVTSWKEIKNFKSKLKSEDAKDISTQSQSTSESCISSSYRSTGRQKNKVSNSRPSPKIYKSPRATTNENKRIKVANNLTLQSTPKRDSTLSKSFDSSFTSLSKSIENISRSPRRLIPSGSLPKFVTGRRKVTSGRSSNHSRKTESSQNTSY